MWIVVKKPALLDCAVVILFNVRQSTINVGQTQHCGLPASLIPCSMLLLTPKSMLLKFSRTLLILCLLCCTFDTIQAQNASRTRSGSFSLTVGYTESLEDRADENRGFYAGANIYRANAERFSYDGQISFTITSGESTIISPICLIGGRYYLTSNAKDTRLFVNALGGFALQFEHDEGRTESQPNLGYSAGVYLEARRFVFGAAIESPENLVFKAGITF